MNDQSSHSLPKSAPRPSSQPQMCTVSIADMDETDSDSSDLDCTDHSERSNSGMLASPISPVSAASPDSAVSKHSFENSVSSFHFNNRSEGGPSAAGVVATGSQKHKRSSTSNSSNLENTEGKKDILFSKSNMEPESERPLKRIRIGSNSVDPSGSGRISERTGLKSDSSIVLGASSEHASDSSKLSPSKNFLETVMMEGVYSTRTGVWRGLWTIEEDPSGKSSKFRYSPANDSAQPEYKDAPCQMCHGLDEHNFLFCDLCDRGFHCHCLNLTSVPQTKHWYCPNCEPVVTRYNNLPPTRLWKGNFQLQGRRIEEQMFMQFDWMTVDKSSRSTTALVMAQVSGNGKNIYGKFDIEGELLVFDAGSDPIELHGWRQYGTCKEAHDCMYKLKIKKMFHDGPDSPRRPSRSSSGGSSDSGSGGIAFSESAAAEIAAHMDSRKRLGQGENEPPIQSNLIDLSGEGHNFLGARGEKVNGQTSQSMPPVSHHTTNNNSATSSSGQPADAFSNSSGSNSGEHVHKKIAETPVAQEAPLFKASQRYAEPKRGGNTSALLSAPAPAPVNFATAANKNHKKDLDTWIKKFRELERKFDRVQVAHRKLKIQHKDHESTLERERLRHDIEIEELQMQLKQERQLRENQNARIKSKSREVFPKQAGDGGEEELASAGKASASSKELVVSNHFNTPITKRQPRRAVALYTDVDCVFHQTPESHPEKAGRVSTLWQRLYAAFDQKLDWCSNSPRAKLETLMLAHSPRYITRFLQACKYLPTSNHPRNFMLCCGGIHGKGGKPGTRGRKGKQVGNASGSSFLKTSNFKAKSSSDHDTFFSSNAGGGSLAAALKSPGSVVTAVDSVLSGQHKNSFCLVRPPGHHCGYDGVPRRGLGEDSDVGQGFCLLNNVAVAACHALHNYPVRVAIIDIDLHHGNVSSICCTTLLR